MSGTNFQAEELLGESKAAPEQGHSHGVAMGPGELCPSLHVCIPMPVAEGNSAWRKGHQSREKGRNAH